MDRDKKNTLETVTECDTVFVVVSVCCLGADLGALGFWMSLFDQNASIRCN